MASDYHDQARLHAHARPQSHAPDYRTGTGTSNGWLIGLAVAAMLGLIAFFSWTGGEAPAPGTASTQVTPQPAPAPPPAAPAN